MVIQLIVSMLKLGSLNIYEKLSFADDQDSRSTTDAVRRITLKAPPANTATPIMLIARAIASNTPHARFPIKPAVHTGLRPNL